MQGSVAKARLLCGVSICAVGFILAGAGYAAAQGAQPSNSTSAQPQPETVELETIVVEGQKSANQPPATGTVGQPPAPYSGGQVGSGSRLGMLGNRSILETPYSVTSFTEKLMRDQQARTVADVVLNDPSVRNDAPPFSERDSFFIRGFSVTNVDLLFDGLSYLSNPRRHYLEGIERVEIFKGPTAMLSGGVGRVGGTINLVPKRATDAPITRLTTGFISDGQFGAHADVGRRFGDQKEWGIRVNGAYRAGDTALDNNEIESGVATLGIDYAGERVRAAFDFSHSTQNIDAPTSLFNSVAATFPAGADVPSAPNGRINTANPSDFIDSKYNMAAGRVEIDVLSNTTVYAAGGLSHYVEDFLSTSYAITNPNGDATASFGFNPQKIRGYSGEVGLRSEFETGWIGHQFNVSATQALNENYRGGYVLNPALPGSYPTNIYNPIYYSGPPVNVGNLPRAEDRPLFADGLYSSVAIADTLSFWDERLQLTLGGRYQVVESRSYSVAGANFGDVTRRYEEDRITPSVAVLAKVTDRFSVYGNYIEALTEGPVAPGTGVTNPSEVFAPVVNEQKEVGVKYDFGTFALTASLFEITQAFGYTTPGTPLGTFAVDGEQVNRGLELTIFGEPVEGFRLLGGVTFLDAELAKNANTALNGNDVPGVPRVAINLYGEYDLPWISPGLTLTGRILYAGETFYDAANTRKVDDWTRVDLGVRYEIEDGPWEKPVVLRANIENVFDENYWASSARGWLAAGAPRTLSLSASFEF